MAENDVLRFVDGLDGLDWGLVQLVFEASFFGFAVT